VQFQVSMRVQMVNCTDLDWRSGLVHLLKPEAIGTEGQQVWLIALEDAALIRERLRINRQPGTVNEKQILGQIGQPSTIEACRGVNYISGLELTSGLYVAYQPVISRLNEGVQATFTPLWSTDGLGVDVDVKLTTHAVTKLHYAQSAAPLASGNQNAAIQVPEVAATSLEHSVNWPRSQVLLISAGVHPGTSGAKRAGLSFSTPPTEILILAEIDPPISNRSAARRDNISNR
jgi:hypothetical protein